MKPPKPTEHDLHVSVVEAFKVMLYPTACYAHVPNEGKRGFKAQRDFKALGCMPGFPDLMVMHAGRICLIELKRQGEKPTKVQLEAHAQLALACFKVYVCRSLNEVILALMDAGIPLRGKLT